MSDKPRYAIQPHGEKFRVIERENSIILRTLDTKSEAYAFINQLEE